MQERKPDWLKIKLPKGVNYKNVRQIVSDNHLHTICVSGNCPNLGDCWGRGTATLMILGDICTRACKFCATKTGIPHPVDETEPERVAETVNLMNLNHVVLTSVDRDDLPDGGSEIWAKTITRIKEIKPGTTIEALIPDFQGNSDQIQTVIRSKPEIISHNLETVRRLTPLLRNKAIYDRSLQVIGQIANSGITSKSGIMVGIGEQFEEVLETMDDLLSVGCRIFTIGQYLRPTPYHIPVSEYVHPDLFEKYKQAGLNKGFKIVESSPLVRSSYHAENHINQ